MEIFSLWNLEALLLIFFSIWTVQQVSAFLYEKIQKQYFYLFIYLFIYLFVYSFIYLFIYLFIHFFLHTRCEFSCPFALYLTYFGVPYVPPLEGLTGSETPLSTVSSSSISLWQAAVSSSPDIISVLWKLNLLKV